MVEESGKTTPVAAVVVEVVGGGVVVVVEVVGGGVVVVVEVVEEGGGRVVVVVEVGGGALSYGHTVGAGRDPPDSCTNTTVTYMAPLPPVANSMPTLLKPE